MGKVEVEVKPSSKRSTCTGYDPWRGAFKLEVKSPPERGLANREVEEVLSRLLSVRRDSVRVVRGATSRIKLIVVDGLADEEIEKKLKEICGKELTPG